MKKNSRLVYSTETGRIKPQEETTVSHDEGDGVVRIFRESRKGSGVSVIKGLPTNTDLKQLAKTLKKTMGVGGSIKDHCIEIQSDQRDKLQTLLQSLGYTVKIAGG